MEMPPSSPPPDNTCLPATSLWSKLVNILVTPGDVFAEVRDRPISHANWLVPTLLACVLGIAAVQMRFSNATLVQQIREQIDRSTEKSLRNLPPEQREQARATIERFTSPTWMSVTQSAGVLLGTPFWLFAKALVVWLLGRFLFKAQVGYLKCLEVCGLTGMITVLGVVVTTLLAFALGSVYAVPGPSLLLREFDATKAAHLLLAALNLITLWYLVVLAIGLGRLCRISALRPFIVLFLGWAVLAGASIWLATLAQRLQS